MGRVVRSKKWGYLGKTEKKVIGILLEAGPMPMTELGAAVYGREPTEGEHRHVRSVVARLAARHVVVRTRRIIQPATATLPPRSTTYVWLLDEHLDIDLPGEVPRETLARLTAWTG